MPPWLQAVAEVLPLKAAVDLVRPLVLEVAGESLQPFLILTAYAACGYYMALVLTRRRFLQVMTRFAEALLRIALLATARALAGRAALADRRLPRAGEGVPVRPASSIRRRWRSLSTSPPGYYLYREQFKFAAKGFDLGPAQIPPGKVKWDQTFEKDVESYRNPQDRPAGGEGVAQF